MENHHRVPLSFDEILSLQHAEGLTNYDSWRQAIIQYNQQRDDYTATTAATINPEIPLSESVLTPQTTAPFVTPKIHLNHPPVNAAGEKDILTACNRDDPNSQKRLKENAERLVDCGVAESLCIDRAVDPSIVERLELSDVPEADPETKRERSLEAHVRFWASTGGVDKEVQKRRPQEP